MTLNDQNASPLPPPGAPPHHHIFGRLRTYFLTGLILVGPIYITINLTWWFINWVDDAMRPFIPISLRTETYLPFRVPGYGLIIALVALTLLGSLTAGLVGRESGRVQQYGRQENQHKNPPAHGTLSLL
jgi:hypothetical protein